MMDGLAATTKSSHEKVANDGWVSSNYKNVYMKRWLIYYFYFCGFIMQGDPALMVCG